MAPLFAAICWSEEVRRLHLKQAFKEFEVAIEGAKLLYYPQPDAVNALTTIVREVGVGAVLEQDVDGGWVALAFF